ncbi:MAG: hypothetical protein JOZ78_24300 [Chroococcidiopsidaceae cyanobacterium CP_BM_ER_R8_30]|nr:hypothetical protein [Chroococcidiopsidaceae cyanobacterium CP_BM_ER_R8_30]
MARSPRHRRSSGGNLQGLRRLRLVVPKNLQAVKAPLASDGQAVWRIYQKINTLSY